MSMATTDVDGFIPIFEIKDDTNVRRSMTAIAMLNGTYCSNTYRNVLLFITM